MAIVLLTQPQPLGRPCGSLDRGGRTGGSEGGGAETQSQRLPGPYGTLCLLCPSALERVPYTDRAGLVHQGAQNHTPCAHLILSFCSRPQCIPRGISFHLHPSPTGAKEDSNLGDGGWEASVLNHPPCPTKHTQKS